MKEFTFIELMIVFTIVAIIATVAYDLYDTQQPYGVQDPNVACIGGYLHNAITGQQIFNNSGVGIKCQ